MCLESWYLWLGTKKCLCFFGMCFAISFIFLNHFPHSWRISALNVFYTWINTDDVMDVTFVEESSRWNGRLKNINKTSINLILVPSQKYQDSRRILQNSKVARNIMGFSNCAQRFTGSNYLDVDSPLS